MMSPSDLNFYLAAIHKEIPRFVSMGDRENWSKTYGCFDRTYWSWKFTDFPGARYQEAIYALGFLADTPKNHPSQENYYNQLWEACGKFWATLQHPDGCFDEAYPYERSFAATAFTTFYVGQSFLQRHHKIAPETASILKKALEKSADWLCKNQENHGVLSNHLAVAAAALETVYNIVEKQSYRDRKNYFINYIMQKQSREGWYEEYGGADPGYQTHTIFYLAQAWVTDQRADLLESLDKSMAFLKDLITPNGTMGGICGSRNTDFFMPAGFEILSPFSSNAHEISQIIKPYFQEGLIVGLPQMDPHNFLPLLNNYIFSHSALKKQGERSQKITSIPLDRTKDTTFLEAGLRVVRKENYMAIVNFHKGGAVQAYFHKKGEVEKNTCVPFIDGGVWVELANGKKYHSQILNKDSKVTLEKDKIIIKSPLASFNQTVMNPWLFIGFRLFTLLTSYVPKLSYVIKKALVFTLVNKKKFANISLLREINFQENEILIIDVLENININTFKQASFGGKFSGIHMGSSRYFSFEEVKNEGAHEILTRQNAYIKTQGSTLRRDKIQWKIH